MRLRTVTAPDARQAMARLRALLGADAIIVATQQVDGGVRITGAVESDEVDLGALLATPQASPCVDRLARVAAPDRDPPLDDHIQRVAALALGDDPLPRLALQLLADAGQHTQPVDDHAAKHRHLLEKDHALNQR